MATLVAENINLTSLLYVEEGRHTHRAAFIPAHKNLARGNIYAGSQLDRHCDAISPVIESVKTLGDCLASQFELLWDCQKRFSN